jgi:ribulose kinase
MFTIGIDFGANSAPALAVRRADGGELGSSVVGYSSGVEGAPLDESDRHHARRQPADCLDGVERCVSIPKHRAVYAKLYAFYRQLHDSFSGPNKSIDLSRFMKTLNEIKYAPQR